MMGKQIIIAFAQAGYVAKPVTLLLLAAYVAVDSGVKLAAVRVVLLLELCFFGRDPPPGLLLSMMS
jgi:hypothetical protein